MDSNLKCGTETMSAVLEAVEDKTDVNSVTTQTKEKNRVYFWSLVEEDIARILIEVKFGNPTHSSLLSSSLYFGSDSVLRETAEFALSFDWIELNNCFMSIVRKEASTMNPVYRIDDKNPGVDEDPLKYYKSGHPFIIACDDFLLGFILKYLACIHPKLPSTFLKLRKVKRYSIYRRIFKRIRFMYCNYYGVTYDLVTRRGPVVIFTLYLKTDVQDSVGAFGLSQLLLEQSSNLPYLYGEAHWMPSKAFWDLFQPFDEFVLSYPFNPETIAIWALPENPTLATFVKQSGSVVWLHEGCSKHANVSFCNVPDDQEAVLKNELEGEWTGKMINSKVMHVLPLDKLRDLDELLLQSRVYDGTDEFDGFAIMPMSIQSRTSRFDYMRVDFSRISKHSELIVVKSHKTAENNFVRDLHWGFIRFEILPTVSDGTCFYDAVRLSISDAFWREIQFTPPANSKDFKHWLFNYTVASVQRYSPVIRRVIDEICKSVCGFGDFETLMTYFFADNRWGAFELALILAVVLRVNLVFITAIDGSFRHTSHFINQFIGNRRNLYFLTEEEYSEVRDLFLQEIVLSKSPAIFILHCDSADPYCVGSEFQKAKGVVSPDSLNHYVGLEFTPEMKEIEMIDLMNHLFLLEQLLWNSSLVDKAKWKDQVPSQNCVSGSCSYMNVPTFE